MACRGKVHDRNNEEDKKVPFFAKRKTRRESGRPHAQKREKTIPIVPGTLRENLNEKCGGRLRTKKR